MHPESRRQFPAPATAAAHLPVAAPSPLSPTGTARANPPATIRVHTRMIKAMGRAATVYGPLHPDRANRPRCRSWSGIAPRLPNDGFSSAQLIATPIQE